jgi:hypothetical protein
MTIRRADPRRQGDIGVGAAIAWFAEHGYHICVPLFESQPYDLVVDDGKRSYHTVKHFDSSRIDLLFVLTDGGDRYVIPAASLREAASTSEAGMTVSEWPRGIRWGERDSNPRRLSRQIYSLLPLAAWVSPRLKQ